MQYEQDGQVIILSDTDADRIAGALTDLMELIYDTFSHRRLLIRPPTDATAARITSDTQRLRTQQLEEQF